MRRLPPTPGRLLRTGTLALLLSSWAPVPAEAASPQHHAQRVHHAKGSKAAAKRRVAHVRPGAKPDVVADAELTGGSVRRGCAAPTQQAGELLDAIGVQDGELQAALQREAAEALAAARDCVPYALLLSHAGTVRALGLHVPGPAGAADRLVLASRATAGAPLDVHVEDLDSTVRDVTTVTVPLREVVAHSLELQAAVPAEALYSLNALVPLLHAPAGGEADDAYLVRAAYGIGSGAESGRLISVEIVERDTHDVLREALWIEREGLPGGFFAPDGTSFEHALWTAPVTFTRISRGIGNFRTTVRRAVARRSGHKTRIVMARSTRRGTHVGVDFAAPVGAPVISVADGRVVDVGMRGGYGNLIVIEHAGGYSTRYAHLSGFAPDIEVGSEVRRGSEIGYVGSTGFSTGPHLHFEIRRDGVYLDPLDERLAFGLWSIRPIDYVPVMRQTLIADATDRLSNAGVGTVLTGSGVPIAASGGATTAPVAGHVLAGDP